MKSVLIALRFFICMTVLTGVIYPLLLTLLSQIGFSHQANGSMIRAGTGAIVGSELIAQNFKDPKYFRPRPSATEFNPMPSGGSNYGPTSNDLVTKIKERTAQGLEGDLLFASGSGLDPHISPEAALSQVPRVSLARGVPESLIRSIVEKFTEGRQFGILGEPRINVLKLNIALDER